jgi:hypothetical protein
MMAQNKAMNSSPKKKAVRSTNKATKSYYSVYTVEELRKMVADHKLSTKENLNRAALLDLLIAKALKDSPKKAKASPKKAKASPKKAKASVKKAVDKGLTVAQIKAVLKQNGVSFASNMKKEDLVKLMASKSTLKVVASPKKIAAPKSSPKKSSSKKSSPKKSSPKKRTYAEELAYLKKKGWTVPQIKELMDKKKISRSGVTKKDDLLALVAKHNIASKKSPSKKAMTPKSSPKKKSPKKKSPKKSSPVKKNLSSTRRNRSFSGELKRLEKKGYDAAALKVFLTNKKVAYPKSAKKEKLMELVARYKSKTLEEKLIVSAVGDAKKAKEAEAVAKTLTVLSNVAKDNKSKKILKAGAKKAEEKAEESKQKSKEKVKKAIVVAASPKKSPPKNKPTRKPEVKKKVRS